MQTTTTTSEIISQVFDSPYDEFANRIGQKFEFLGKIEPTETGHEYDIDEVGNMYRIKFTDGQIISCWPEEIFDDYIKDWKR